MVCPNCEVKYDDSVVVDSDRIRSRRGRRRCLFGIGLRKRAERQ